MGGGGGKRLLEDRVWMAAECGCASMHLCKKGVDWLTPIPPRCINKSDPNLSLGGGSYLTSSSR